jgi:hypothetical protein
LIFDEKKYALNLLKNGFSTSYINFNDLCILAKYFKYIGKNKTQIRKNLQDFCIKFGQEYNEVLFRDRLEKAIRQSQKYGIRIPIDINVTETELEKIKSVGDYKRQKILFVMLVIAKYFKYTDSRLQDKRKRVNTNFYVNENFIDILELANVNIQRLERRDILYDLEQSGLISTKGNKDGNVYFLINFIDEESDVAIVINNIDNIVKFYPVYCENCGKIIRDKSKMHMLCRDCYEKDLKERRRNFSKESMRRIRDKNDILDEKC